MSKNRALKSNNYSNVLMTALDGTPMFRCGQKKLTWYLSRNLAEIVSQDEETIARFLFEPKGFGWAYDDYFLSVKNNICVVCSSIEGLTRHHVMPYCYRRYFPEDVKSHNSYDIVLLCVEHHEEYEYLADCFKKELAIKHQAPLNGIGGRTDTNISRANAFKRTLLKNNNIPHDRQQDMLQHILKISNQIKEESLQRLTLADLKDMETFSCSVRPHTQHGEIVVKHYDCDDFAILWRNHFVNHMKPQALPDYWITDRRIYEEAREKQVSKGRDWSDLTDD
jgi:exonuclease 3'-5' domain-containing protein 2